MVFLLKWFWYSAITVYPFVLIRERDYSRVVLNHEYIHLKQQLEMLIVFAYVWFAIEFLFKLLYYRNFRKAYMSVSFEREAVAGERLIGYLSVRKPYTWLKFIYIKNKKHDNSKTA